MSVEQLPLFVYGTLLPDQPNAYLWGDGITKVETAVFRYGRLYDFIHYPMLLETKGGEVKGALVTVKPSVYERTLALLDDLEGYNPAAPPQACAYWRKKRSINTKNARNIQAWIYVGNPLFVNGQPQIAGGDWVSYASQRQLDTTDWWNNIDSVRDLHNTE